VRAEIDALVVMFCCLFCCCVRTGDTWWSGEVDAPGTIAAQGQIIAGSSQERGPVHAQEQWRDAAGTAVERPLLPFEHHNNHP